MWDTCDIRRFVSIEMTGSWIDLRILQNGGEGKLAEIIVLLVHDSKIVALGNFLKIEVHTFKVFFQCSGSPILEKRF